MFTSGSKFNGTKTIDGKREGAGTYIYANGDKFIAEWKDDEVEGQGTFSDLKNNSTILSAICISFKNGAMSFKS